jgi:hypothetical protein
MLRYIERHLLRNEAGNETAWRIQTFSDKLILEQPLWPWTYLIETHPLLQKWVWFCENSELLILIKSKISYTSLLYSNC